MHYAGKRKKLRAASAPKFKVGAQWASCFNIIVVLQTAIYLYGSSTIPFKGEASLCAVLVRAIKRILSYLVGFKATPSTFPYYCRPSPLQRNEDSTYIYLHGNIFVKCINTNNSVLPLFEKNGPGYIYIQNKNMLFPCIGSHSLLTKERRVATYSGGWPVLGNLDSAISLKIKPCVFPSYIAHLLLGHIIIAS